MDKIIDGDNAVFGRICSYAAKQALEGNKIIIVNSEKVIITGNKKDIINKYKTLRTKGGHSQKGPNFSVLTYKILKRGIRGMLPNYRKGIGKQAFSRVRCFNGVPEEYKDKEKIKFKGPKKGIGLKELSKKI